jgi:hypothetical protein
LFDPTIPEEQGIIDREKMLSISGRSRKPQIELAEKLNITEYPCPAGGCLLTDPQFSKRAKDLLGHYEFTLDNVKLLKLGRHFRLSVASRLVVGRNEQENNLIMGLAKEGDILMNAGNVPAPVGLLKGEVKNEVLESGLRIIARYTDAKKGTVLAENCPLTVAMEYWKAGSEQKTTVKVEPLSEKELEKLRI